MTQILLFDGRVMTVMEMCAEIERLEQALAEALGDAPQDGEDGPPVCDVLDCPGYGTRHGQSVSR